MESHRTGFPPSPLLLEIPSGFPHSHRLDDGINISKQLQMEQIVLSSNIARGLQRMSRVHNVTHVPVH